MSIRPGGLRPRAGQARAVQARAGQARAVLAETVPAAFDAGAFAYDRLVGANPGYHEHLRLSARRLRLPGQGRGLRLLDAGCGTGASTAALLAAAPHAEIVAFDASGAMLARARAKPWPPSVTFVQARAEELAAAGVRGSFDAILAAFLVRNVPDRDAVLRDLRGLLRPGGTLAVHEYSVADSRRARAVWQAVCAAVIIPAGRVAGGDAALYRYLRDSVATFDGAARFRRRLGDAGFTGVHSETVPGWPRGIVHTFLASRPARPGDLDGGGTGAGDRAVGGTAAADEQGAGGTGTGGVEVVGREVTGPAAGDTRAGESGAGDTRAGSGEAGSTGIGSAGSGHR